MTCALMTDINEIRLQNARTLAETHCGSMTKFADKLDRSPTQISRIIGKNPTKMIGNRLARHIETQFDKEHGWLDQLHQNQPQDTTATEVTEAPALYAAITGSTDQLELLRSVIETVEVIEIEEGLKLSPEEKARTIIACLKICIKRGMHHATDKTIIATAIQAVI